MAGTTVRQVVDYLQTEGQVIGLAAVDSEILARRVDHVEADTDATATGLSWISRRVAAEQPERLRGYRGCLALVPDVELSKELTAASRSNAPMLVVCREPKLAFCLAAKKFGLDARVYGDPAPVIHASAQISEGVRFGPGVIVAADARIGANTVLEHCTIGERSTVGCNCTIGGDGFGFARAATGRWVRFPHVGRAVVEADVEIGSNTCIDRGALGDTTIGRGTRIDNLVHIAHNVRIGANCLVIAHAMIAGSVEIGDGSWIAPGAMILNQLRVGRDALAGMGAVVLKDVADSTRVAGSPARELPGAPNLTSI